MKKKFKYLNFIIIIFLFTGVRGEITNFAKGKKIF